MQAVDFDRALPRFELLVRCFVPPPPLLSSRACRVLLLPLPPPEDREDEDEGAFCEPPNPVSILYDSRRRVFFFGCGFGQKPASLRSAARAIAAWSLRLGTKMLARKTAYGSPAIAPARIPLLERSTDCIACPLRGKPFCLGSFKCCQCEVSCRC